MTRKIVAFPVPKSLDIPADQILRDALGQLREVVLIGIGKDGREYFASSIADGPNVNWMLDRTKRALLEISDSDQH